MSGVAGCGKTFFSKKLGEALNLPVLNLKDLCLEKGLTDSYDKISDSHIIDIDVVNEYILVYGFDDCILDGLFSHKLDVATHIIVLRCSPLTLFGRLSERNYSPQKIRENIEAEFMGVILYESLDGCDNVLEIDSEDIDAINKTLIWLESGGKEIVETDWSEEFMKVLSI